MLADGERYRLICGDCLVEMGTIPDRSIDLVLCDLPYAATDCKWDSMIPLDKLWDCYRRILKETGSVVLTSIQPFTSILVMSNPSWFKYDVVWDKLNRNTGYGNKSHAPLRRHENIVVFCQGKTVYNPQMEKGKPYIAQRSGEKPDVYQNGGLNPIDGFSDGMRYPVSVIEYPADIKTEIGLHPTQKPVGLMEGLVLTYSNSGDVVLDNCMGSGTTGVACIRTDRKFIGIDNNNEYFNTVSLRLETELKLIDRPHFQAPSMRRRKKLAATPLFGDDTNATD